MATAESLISGWLPSPYDNDDDVDLVHMQLPSFDLAKPPAGFIPSSSISTPSSDDSLSLALDTNPPPSPSVESVDIFDHMSRPRHTKSASTSSLSSSERRTARKRSVDPDYIPRPRNAFIIFRCEYAPTHKRGTAGAPVKGTPDSQKTLSGRAGEVWKSMSEAERAVYKARAEQEKVAHALRNPDYRFQPDRKRRRAATDAGFGRDGVLPPQAPARAAHTHVAWDSAAVDAPPTTGRVKAESAPTILMGRRRSSSMPQPMSQPQPRPFAAPPAYLSNLSCVSSPGPEWIDTPATSLADEDEQPPSTPSEAATSFFDSPRAHELGMGAHMVPLRDPALFTADFSFDPSLEQTSFHQNSPAMPLPAAPEAYTPAEPALPFHVSPFGDAQYPSPLELISSSFADWSQDTGAGPAQFAPEAYPAPAPAGGAYLPIPFPDQLHAAPAPAPALWGAPADANMALYMNALDTYSIPTAQDTYEPPAAGVSFDDFFHAM